MIRNEIMMSLVYSTEQIRTVHYSTSQLPQQICPQCPIASALLHLAQSPRIDGSSSMLETRQLGDRRARRTHTLLTSRRRAMTISVLT